VLEVVLLALGTSTAKAVARMWTQSEYATDISGGLIDSLSSRIPGLVERRRTAREFEGMAERVVQQMTPLLEHEYRGLPANELSAAVLGVADVIDSLQSITPDLLFSIDVEPLALEGLLLAQPASRVRRDLSPAATAVFERLLRENCNYIIELTMNMPQFTGLALAELLRRGTEISERVERAFARIPQPAAIEADADQEFGVRYRRHISRELDRLELFGLTLSESASRYELSIAYITLGASTSDDVESRPEQRSEKGKIAIDAAAGDGSTDAEVEAEAMVDGTYLRVDEALARGSRHLIRGEAGSGKTTLLQWLAVTASREAFAHDLQSWSGHVPFFIQLRRYVNDGLPAPEDLLAHTAGTIAGVMPPGWVHRQLSSGKALLLIDGVDELPEHQRDHARRWLLTMLSEFPDCKYVITTRPPAVPEDWLAEGAFSISELLPMSLPDILSFVNHWYDAARRAAAHIEGQEERLTAFQGELTRVIRDNPTIRALATAPLLCAMLCALNRDRRTQLPRDRMELYRIALESLLDRRDAERQIVESDDLNLNLREKETLLQDLAYWLILNEQTDVGSAGAIERIGVRLEYISSIRSTPDQVFRHLLTRSGLIREPVHGRIDFIHRTFQEYLGAARAMSEGNVPLLISKAHDDHWREVIILSAGHGTTSQCDQLLLGILERGRSEDALRHRLHLLTAACLETAIELSPDTTAAVRRAMEETLPPTNMTEARAVASAGPLAAPLLSAFTAERATIAAACVRALCLIGGEPGMSALGAFRADKRVTVSRELIRGWEYFDRATYARRILASSSLDYGRIVVADTESLAAIDELPGDARVTFAPSSGVRSLALLPNRDRVTALDLKRSWQLESLDGIGEFTRLQILRLAHNLSLRRLPELPPSLMSVSVRMCLNLDDISALASLPELMDVELSGLSVGTADLAGSPVRDLRLEECEVTDLSWLSSLTNLERVSITRTQRPEEGSALPLGPDGDCSYLSDLPLARLHMWPAGALRSLDGLPRTLRILQLVKLGELREAEALAELKLLTHLMVDGAGRLEDFTFLRGLGRLQDIDLEDCQRFSDLDWLPETAPISRLVLSGTSVRDLTLLRRYPRLRQLLVVGCPIDSLEPLLVHPARMFLWLDRATYDRTSEELRARHRLRVRDEIFGRVHRGGV